MAPMEDVKTLKCSVLFEVLGFSVVYRVKVVHDIKHIKVLKTLCFTGILAHEVVTGRLCYLLNLLKSTSKVTQEPSTKKYYRKRTAHVT